MGVGIECDANVAMSQALTHYLRMNALLEHKAGVCVTQIMESYAGNACPSKFRKGASFLVHSLTELELRKLRWKEASGTYEGGFLWQPSVILGKPNTFLGYPIHTQDDMGHDVTALYHYMQPPSLHPANPHSSEACSHAPLPSYCGIIVFIYTGEHLMTTSPPSSAMYCLASTTI